jgi:transcriptional regulator with XRE-family HTH domain
MAFDLTKIGKELRENRETKGLTVRDVSNVLCLRTSLVEALESGDRDSLPHEVYIRGYIKEYASLLGVWDRIAEELAREQAPAPSPPQKIPEPVAETKKPLKTRAKKRLTLRPAFIYVSAILVAVAFFVIQNMETKSPPVTPKFENVGKISSEPPNRNGETGNSSATQEGKRLMVTCSERTWVSVIIDGSEKKELMLNPHEVMVLSAKVQFDLLIGNAGGVKVFFNGKDTGFGGKQGEVKRIKLS